MDRRPLAGGGRRLDARGRDRVHRGRRGGLSGDANRTHIAVGTVAARPSPSSGPATSPSPRPMRCPPAPAPSACRSDRPKGTVPRRSDWTGPPSSVGLRPVGSARRSSPAARRSAAWWRSGSGARRRRRGSCCGWRRRGVRRGAAARHVPSATTLARRRRRRGRAAGRAQALVEGDRGLARYRYGRL